MVPAGHSWKVLIADDSISIRNAISDTLTHSGFQVVAAHNGKEAWEILNDWKKKAVESDTPLSAYVDLIISDIEMPEMDGHSLTRQIKEDPALKNCPVMLFSSLITDALRHKGVAVGADDQVSKPDLPDLARRAAALISKRKGLG